MDSLSGNQVEGNIPDKVEQIENAPSKLIQNLVSAKGWELGMYSHWVSHDTLKLKFRIRETPNLMMCAGKKVGP